MLPEKKKKDVVLVSREKSAFSKHFCRLNIFQCNVCRLIEVDLTKVVEGLDTLNKIISMMPAVNTLEKEKTTTNKYGNSKTE